MESSVSLKSSMKDEADSSSITSASAVKEGNILVILSEKVIFFIVGLLESSAIASAIFSLPSGQRRNFCAAVNDVDGVFVVIGGVGGIPLNLGVGGKTLPLLLLLLLLSSSSSSLLLLRKPRLRLKSVNLSSLSC